MKLKSKTLEMTMVALGAALIIVMAQLVIPMPSGVPMTLQTFAITLIAIVLGPRLSTYSTLIYLLLGAIGLPVFAGMKGGIQVLAGPTGGFLWSFPLMALLIGLGAQYIREKKWLFLALLVAGTLANYAVGIMAFMVITGASFWPAFMACFVPFIPTTIIKAVMAIVIGIPIRKALKDYGGKQ